MSSAAVTSSTQICQVASPKSPLLSPQPSRSICSTAKPAAASARACSALAQTAPDEALPADVPLIRDLFSKKAHGPVQMMQLEILAAAYNQIPLPLVAASV